MGELITALIAAGAVGSVLLLIRAKVREAGGNGCSGCAGRNCTQCAKHKLRGGEPPCK